MRILDWKSLTASERDDALRRPAQRDAEAAGAVARQIIDAVRSRGDAALAELTERYDGVRLTDLAVSNREFDAADRALSTAQHAAIDTAISTVRAFHAAQGAAPLRVETAPGVLCERFSVAIRAVGLYVPAGSAPLPSTAIMLCVPASLAGCPVRVMCTAPTRGGTADPAVLVAARKAGVNQVFKAGGAQAIAAMAYGTQSIPKCDKVFGPGNVWVTAAKLLVANDAAGAAADLPAGVTEVMVIADDGARADFVAADLLAQAEHSADAQALLVTTSALLAAQVAEQVQRQMGALSRAAILSKSVPHMRLLVVDSLETAFEVANDYAPEHLLLQIEQPRRWLSRVTAAGAVFGRAALGRATWPGSISDTAISPATSAFRSATRRWPRGVRLTILRRLSRGSSCASTRSWPALPKECQRDSAAILREADDCAMPSRWARSPMDRPSCCAMVRNDRAYWIGMSGS